MTSKAAILRLERQQEKDFNRQHLGRLLAQFGPGFVGFSSTRHARITGRSALKRTFLHYLRQSPRVGYRIAQPRVQVLDGCAVASFYWTVQLGPRRKCGAAAATSSSARARPGASSTNTSHARIEPVGKNRGEAHGHPVLPLLELCGCGRPKKRAGPEGPAPGLTGFTVWLR